jgi:hypothetical protein
MLKSVKKMAKESLHPIQYTSNLLQLLIGFAKKTDNYE